MATKVKPIRLNITWTPNVWQVPTYVDADTFAWWAWWGWGASFGRFLSLWDSTTGQPISFPEATPYSYLTWDYYIVETVSSATPPVNYRPTWSSYTGTASSVIELDEIEVWDTYVYDGTTWLLQSNHGKTVTFANIAWDPYDNANLDSALDAKQDVLVSWTNIKTVNNNSLLWSGDVSVWDVKYTDYNWTTLTGNSVTLALNSQITPTANFTVNAPWTIKDWQEYILRVTSGWTVYAITLGTNMSNPNNVDTTLTANSVDQFVFLAVWWQLELQPRDKDTTYTASTWISISAQNEISNTWVTSFNGSTWAVTYTAPVTSVNIQTWAVVLDADDISDSTTTNKFVTATDKTTWNWKQNALSYYSEWTNTADITVGSWNDTSSINANNINWIELEATRHWYATSSVQVWWTSAVIASSDSVDTTTVTVSSNNVTVTTPSKTYSFDNDGTTWVARLSDIPASWIQNDTTGTTTTVTKIWAWTEAEYALITPTSWVEYHVYPN